MICSQIRKNIEQLHIAWTHFLFIAFDIIVCLFSCGNSLACQGKVDIQLHVDETFASSSELLAESVHRLSLAIDQVAKASVKQSRYDYACVYEDCVVEELFA